MADEMTSSQRDMVNTLLFQMQRGLLVLPDVAIAEIVDFKSVEGGDNEEAPWYLGQFSWRNIAIPLISFDLLNGDATSLNNARKVVVMNNVHQRDKALYWAFVINQAPKMQNINEEALVAIADAELGEATALQAEMLGETVLFPDLEKIETHIAAL